MSVKPVDHADLAASRLTGLWQDKEKWKALLSGLASSFDDIEAPCTVIAQLDDVDAKNDDGSYVVSGVNLDVLGKRVGQPRRLTNAIQLQYFGWDDDADALGWGEDDDEQAGGSWYEDGASTLADTLMDDPTYRVLIRLRRLKNAAKLPTFETIINALKFVFPDLVSVSVYLTEVPVTIVFGLGREPTQLEIAMIRYSDAFPKPAGVRLSCYWWPASLPTFSWDDDPDFTAAGWGEEGDPSAGGVFAEEF